MITQKEIGLHTRLSKAIPMLKDGYNPVINTKNAVYVFSVTLTHLGTLMYTKFQDNTAIYTVHIPFSYRDCLLDMIVKGENGLYQFSDPILTTIPV